MKRILKPAVVALLTAMTAGCVAHGPLREKMYVPQVDSARAQSRVVLVREPGPPSHLFHKELPWASVDLDLERYPAASAAMLGSLFERVSVATTAAQAPEADFLVRLSTDYPRAIGLTFEDRSGAAAASFSQPGWEVPKSPEADSLLVKIISAPALVVSVGTLGLAYAYRAYDARDRISGRLSEVTAKALAELRAQIAATPTLLGSHAYEKIAEPAPPRQPQACREPMTDAQVSKEAREFFERGQNYLELAKSPAEYRIAAAELNKALSLAPCWPSVRLSCAMAEEGAHEWKNAAEQLRSYLGLTGESADTGKVRARISELESRPSAGGNAP